MVGAQVQQTPAPMTGPRRTLTKENKMVELDLMIENMVKQFIKGNLND